MEFRWNIYALFIIQNIWRIYDIKRFRQTTTADIHLVSFFSLSLSNNLNGWEL